MKIPVLWLGLLSLVITVPAALAEDWRTTGNEGQKLEQLLAAMPGTAHWMFEMGERYKNLYWAGKQGKLEFAEYQLEEIEGLVRMVQLTRPKRKATAQEFLDTSIPAMQESLRGRQWKAFKTGFNQLAQGCMHCHVQNDHAFITLPSEPVSAGSPVLNLAHEND
jgi:hypothetical protein